MKRNGKNTRLLENLVEIPVLLSHHKKWDEYAELHGLLDSVDARFFWIDAALLFDAAETRLLNSAEDAVGYDWMQATEAYTDLILGDGTEGMKPKLAAVQAITEAGAIQHARK